MTFAATPLAKQLSDARNSGTPLTALPTDGVPETRDEAYRVQDGQFPALGPVGGWKVSSGTGPTPICSPLPQSGYMQSGACVNLGNIHVRLVEVEVAARLSRDLPPREMPYSKDEVARAVGGLAPALEIIASRFGKGIEPPMLLGLADLHNNGGVVVGPETAEWAGLDLSTVTVRLSMGGREIDRTDKGPSTGDLLDAIAYLANVAAPRHGGLRAGQVIITGSRVKQPAGSGDSIVGTIAGLGEVTCTIA